MAIQIIVVAGAVYLFYGVLLYIFQRTLLFPGMALSVEASPPPNGGVLVVPLASGNVRVEAWFVPASVPNTSCVPTVIFAHGNYETIDTSLESIAGYSAIGVNVLLIEYPGFGRSPGTPSEENIALAFAAGYDWLIETGRGTKSTILAHGRSVGGGAVCALSRRRELAGLILQSTFTSVRSFARRYLMPGFLVRDAFDNCKRLAVFPGPVLIAHGKHDELIPFRHAERLHKVAERSNLLAFECGHNDCPGDEDEYWHAISDFIETHCAKG